LIFNRIPTLNSIELWSHNIRVTHCQPLNGFQTSMTSSPEQTRYLSCMHAVGPDYRPHTTNYIDLCQHCKSNWHG